MPHAQPHQSHQAGGLSLLVIMRVRDFALEFLCGLDQLSRRTGMDADGIGDFVIEGFHFELPLSFTDCSGIKKDQTTEYDMSIRWFGLACLTSYNPNIQLLETV